MNLSLLVLLTVFLVIAARKIGRVPVKIWQTMTAGSLVVLATGQISPQEAWQAIELDVMVFLLGMFVVGEALVASGSLYDLAYRVLSPVRSAEGLVCLLVFGAGLASAVLMNDTLAVVGTPLVLRLAQEHRVEPRLLLLALAIGITTGSVMSPIGNPQNLLIAIGGGMRSPFLSFLEALAIPTFLSLALAFLVLRVVLRRAFHADQLVHSRVSIKDPALARMAHLSVMIVFALIGLRMLLVAVGRPVELPLSAIAVGAASPLLLFSRRRLALLKLIDWPTLVFFAAMFVLMRSVWQSGALQAWTAQLAADLTSVPVIMILSLTLSQLMSNVPLVALYLPLIGQAAGHDLTPLLALAAGSTVAGNLLILGAASNVIIIQRAERDGHSLSFWDFARVGIPLTVMQGLVYSLYLVWFVA